MFGLVAFGIGLGVGDSGLRGHGLCHGPCLAIALGQCRLAGAESAGQLG